MMTERKEKVTFNDDASDVGNVSTVASLPRPVTGVSITSKATTAPQIFRIPVFAEPQQPEVPLTSPARSPRPPSRPTTSGSMNTSKPGSSQGNKKFNVNLDNRMLMKLATILPSESSRRPDTTPGNTLANGSIASSNSAAPQGVGAIGRLPESRTNLLKLHAELDEMITDIHSLTLESDRYNIALANDLFNNNDVDTANAMEGGNILYDTIIAELTMQGIRKVNRIKKFYRNHITRMKSNHEEDLCQLQVQLEEMTARYHELQIKHSTDIMRLRSTDSGDPQHSVDEQNIKVDNVETGGLFVHFDESNTVPLPTQSHREQLHNYISDRLDHERKLSMNKVNVLSKELLRAQDELKQAHTEIHQLKQQLLDKDKTTIQKDKVALKDLNSYLKNLLDQYK